MFTLEDAVSGGVMDPHLSAPQVRIVLGMWGQLEGPLDGLELDEGIGQHQILVALHLVLEQPMGTDHLLAGQLSLTQDFLDQE